MSSMNVFTRKCGIPICHVLMTVQKRSIGRRSYLTKTDILFDFYANKNWAVSTDVNLLGLDETSSVAYNSRYAPAVVSVCGCFFVVVNLLFQSRTGRNEINKSNQINKICCIFLHPYVGGFYSTYWSSKKCHASQF